MKKRIILATIAVAFVHLVLTLGMGIVSMMAGMEAFDNPDYQPGVIAQLADSTARILMQPGMSLWTPWMSKNLPNIVEWILFLGNSLFWGLGLSLLICVPTSLKRRAPA
ncbi:MAG: hypothetical protein JW888_03130 [Pirellulales bacterium]|nr:hypothetical protein [Pirellulales bacterium]